MMNISAFLIGLLIFFIFVVLPVCIKVWIAHCIINTLEKRD